MATPLSIKNLALARLGEEPLDELDDYSMRAVAINALYSDIRDMVLADHPWNFATLRAQLTPLEAPPLFGYDYAYAKPAGCLRFWGICGADGEVDANLTYKVEGTNIITNAQAEGILPVMYTRQVTDESLFDIVFVSSFALRLAAEAAYRLTKNAALKQVILKEYLFELSKAKAKDSQEGTPHVQQDESWYEARG